MTQSPWRYRGAANGSYGSISILRFDASQEMLWMGDMFGYVSSFVVQSPVQEELAWHLYSSFRAFKDTCIAIKQLSTDDFEAMCFASAANHLKITKRGGFTLHATEINSTLQKKVMAVGTDMREDSILIGGETPGLLRLSMGAPDDIVELPTTGTSGVSELVRMGDSWVTGCLNGDIVMRSAGSLLETHTISSAFPGRVTAIDRLDDNAFVISGTVERNKACIKFYDVRNLSNPLNSVNVHGPTVSLASFDHNERDHCVMQLFPNGYNVVDATASEPLYSSSGVDGACTAMAVSANRNCCTIGSDKGFFFSLSAVQCGTDFQICTGKQPAQPIMPQFTTSWSENKDGKVEASFDTTVPEESLLSAWPPSNYMITASDCRLRPPPKQLQVGQLSINNYGLRRCDAYLPDPKDKIGRVIPNPYPFNTLLGEDPTNVAENVVKLLKRYKREVGRAKSDLGLHSKPEEAINICYHRDFDWTSCNQSKNLVTIDNSIVESWVTTICMIWYNLHPPNYPLRKVLLRHYCNEQFCVACEMSFIFANMAVKSGTMTEPIVPCHHLLTTLRKFPDMEEIFKPAANRDEAVSRMHKFQIWLLKRLDFEFKNAKSDTMHGEDLSSFVTATFGTEFSAVRHQIAPSFHWDVPASATKVDEGLQHLLKQLETFNGEQVQIRRLPPILVLVLNPDHGSLKPPQSLKFSRPPKEEYNYLLVANVIHLADDADDLGHFVTHLRVTLSGDFVLVNDYMVSPQMSEDNLEAHIPPITTHSTVVCYYALDQFRGPKFGASKADDLRPPSLFDTAGPLLLEDSYAKQIRSTKKPTIPVPVAPQLRLEELLPEHIVAIDAEYVVMDWCNPIDLDEPEWLRRQKKNNMTLARLSCLLSKGPGDEQTIIDDFVATKDCVQDYVSQYSGIHDGDLDPEVSKNHLTSLKATYLKLRALVDRGCRILGHGLAQDFRVLNIAVPQHQIIDTLEIFYRPGMRRLALRFLAYHVLGERVQEDERGHDSVEDARTALRLFRRYESLDESGDFDAMLDHLYDIGADTNWHVPTVQSLEPTPQTPPVAPTESPIDPPPISDESA